jgi:hypothetical protein
VTESYKVGVAIALSSNATQIFGALGKHFLGLEKHVKNFQDNWKKTAMLIGGGVGIFGGVAVLKVAEKLIDHGNNLVKIQRDMAQAGATNVQVQAAYAKAWELTAKYQNMGAVDILKVMNDARAIFGNQDVATKDIEPLIRIGSFLRAYQGAEKGKSTHDSILREINAGLKSGEISGNITPEDMSKHADNLAAMKVYYGDQVSIARYLQAQRAAGVSYLTSGDEFRYGMFPALVQEFGPGAGVMQQTLWAKTVAGVMNRTKSLQVMDQYGLLKPGEVEYDKVGRAIGLKHGGQSIYGSEVAADNYPKWVMETVIPDVLKKTGIVAGADGRFSKPDLTTIASIIGQFFPDRNAMKAVMEAVVQYPKLLKDAAGLLKVRKDWETYTTGSWDYQKEAFQTQWSSFLDALGAPMVKTATENLAKMNKVLSGLSQWAAKPENAGTVENMMTGLVGAGAFLVGGGIIAMLAAFGLPGIIAGAVAAIVVAAFTNENFSKWLKGDDISRWLNQAIVDPLQRWLSSDSIAKAFEGLGAKIWQAIKDQVSGIFAGLNMGWGPSRDESGHMKDPGLLDKYIWGNKGGASGSWEPGGGASGSWDDLRKKQNFRFDPGTSRPQTTHTAFSFNVDGHVLAQTVIEKIEELTEQATGSPNSNALGRFDRADAGGFATV